MRDSIYCEKCGAEMLPIDPHKPIGMKCPQCGWGWATSYIDPIMEDAVDYTVRLLSGNLSSNDVIETISHIMGTNYLQARKIIESAPAKVFTGRATAVKNVLKILDASSVRYEVEPPFPYEIDK